MTVRETSQGSLKLKRNQGDHRACPKDKFDTASKRLSYKLFLTLDMTPIAKPMISMGDSRAHRLRQNRHGRTSR